MKKKRVLIQVLFLLAGIIAYGNAFAGKTVLPVAILSFEERGMEMAGQGQTVQDLLFINLSQDSKLMMIERKELKNIIKEAELNLSGMVQQDQAIQVGRLTGAKIVITGSLFDVSGKKYIVAKIIGTETGRVLGTSVSGTDEIDVLTQQLAEQVSAAIDKDVDNILPETVDKKSRIAAIKEKLKGKKLPTAYIHIKEMHIAQQVIDPAAETEMMVIYKEVGGTVIDSEADKGQAEIKIMGEGFSEFATRINNLVGVKARLEVKAVNKKGQVIAVDRQTIVKVDLNEMLAGKTALQEAAEMIAERLIPQLAE